MSYNTLHEYSFTNFITHKTIISVFIVRAHKIHYKSAHLSLSLSSHSQKHTPVQNDNICSNTITQRPIVWWKYAKCNTNHFISLLIKSIVVIAIVPASAFFTRYLCHPRRYCHRQSSSCASSAGNYLHLNVHHLDDSRDYRRLLVQLEETERRFDDFWNTHLTRLKQCLDLRRFEQDFRELQVSFVLDVDVKRFWG